MSSTQLHNPLIYSDFPDPDIVRVGDDYYMVSTAMHFFPGAQILHSRDLVHWGHCAYVYDTLGETPQQRMDDGLLYGRGMWAASLRHHDGRFYLLFTCNDTGHSYLYTAETPDHWTRQPLEGFYYDPSLFFDDDGRVYIAHGNRRVRLTEMLPDVSAPLPGGLDEEILIDSDDIMLGWEGSHLHKINGVYCLFNIHWHSGSLRAQGCHTAQTLRGPWVGGEILCESVDKTNNGVAQGGAIDTPQGDWYLLLFQDHGAQGRMPVLVPMGWEDGHPTAPGAPATFAVPLPTVEQEPLFASDTLRGHKHALWQWNHEPHDDCWTLTPDGLRLTTDRVVPTLEHAVNTLTQRCFGPHFICEVTVDASSLQDGDTAGICALQGCYGALALRRQENALSLVHISRHDAPDSQELVTDETTLWQLSDAPQRLRATFDFTRDIVQFSYRTHDTWTNAGSEHHLFFRLDHFTGTRVGLFLYSTKQSGGSAVFCDFTCQTIEA